MPSHVRESARVKLWFERIKQANRLYGEWSKRFDTSRLEDYYLGHQWRGTPEETARDKYVINMVYSSIETNRPALIFHRPQVRVQPRPNRTRTFGSRSDARARLSQDTIQTFIDDPDIGFALETALALQEAHFRFGVVEVGYTADWIDNPYAGKPILKEDKDKPVRDFRNRAPGGELLPDASDVLPDDVRFLRSTDGELVRQADRIVEREDLYVRRIPAKDFRVSISNRNQLSSNDWAGYREWHYLEDVRRNKGYYTTGLKASGTIRKEYAGEEEEESPEDRERRHGMVLLWKVWDLRSGVRHVLAEGFDKFLVEDRPYKFLPFAVHRFHEILDSFYPLPPIYQWLSPQDEINETREMQRAHRRRFYRRYTVHPSVDENELRKLEDGGDGAYAKIPSEQAPIPVPDAPLDGQVWRHLDESKSDFIQVSGVTHEQRGIAESETATQATIIDARSRIRESAARIKVSEWLSEVSRLMLLTIRENMALPVWIKHNVDPIAAAQEEQIRAIAAETGLPPPPPGPGSVEEAAQGWLEITSESLGDFDLEVSIDLASMSPITEESQRTSWSQVLALLVNPSLLSIFAQSEVILRRTLSLYGIRSENEVREVQRVAQSIVDQMREAAQAEMMSKGSPGAAASSTSVPAGPASAVMDRLRAMTETPTPGIQ